MAAPRDRPPISIAIAAWAGDVSLLACLDSLQSQCANVEVIAAVNGPVANVSRQFPSVRFIEAPRDADVFRLRTLAVEAASGQLIALTEDHSTFGPFWVETLLAAHAEGKGIVGGPVDNGLVGRAFDWALYFLEYGLHMPPVAEGPVRIVSGFNVAYDRKLLMSVREIWKETLHENEINDALREKGHGVHMAPEAWVRSHLPMGLRGAMAHLYGGGRQYGRYRSSKASRMGRVFWILVSPLVPFILLARIAGCVAARNPRRLWHMFRGLPHLALVLGAWSVGEAWGYVKGPPLVGA